MKKANIYISPLTEVMTLSTRALWDLAEVTDIPIVGAPGRRDTMLPKTHTL